MFHKWPSKELREIGSSSYHQAGDWDPLNSAQLAPMPRQVDRCSKCQRCLEQCLNSGRLWQSKYGMHIFPFRRVLDVHV